MPGNSPRLPDLRPAAPAAEPRPEATAGRGGHWFDRLALIGQKRGQLPGLVAALLLGLIEAAAQVLDLVGKLLAFPLVQRVALGHAFAQLLKLALQTPVLKAQIERFEIVQIWFFRTVRGPLGGKGPVQLGGVDGIGAVRVLCGGNHAAADSLGDGGLGLAGRLGCCSDGVHGGVAYRSKWVFGNGSRKRLPVELPPALLSTSSAPTRVAAWRFEQGGKPPLCLSPRGGEHPARRKERRAGACSIPLWMLRRITGRCANLHLCTIRCNVRQRRSTNDKIV